MATDPGATLNPPAGDDVLADLASRLGLTLPDELIASMRRHDGADNSRVGPGFSFPGNFHLLDAAGIAAHAAVGATLLSRDASDRGWYWHEAWIPFAADFSGDYLVYDTRADRPYGTVFYRHLDQGPFGGTWDSLRSLLKDTLDALAQKPATLGGRLPADFPHRSGWATSRATVEADQLVWLDTRD